MQGDRRPTSVRSHESGEDDLVEGSTAAAASNEHGTEFARSAISHSSIVQQSSDVTAARPAFVGSSRGSSYSSSVLGDLRMSINPMTEVEESLRLAELTSPVQERFSYSSTSSEGSNRGPGMAQEGVGRDQGEMQTRQGSRDKMDLSLPENDGMRALRGKMHEIRLLAISTEEKAKMMHYLMTQDYMAHKAVTTSPLSMESGNSNKGMEEEPAALDVGLAAMPIDPSNPYSLRPGDTEPSWSPLPPNPREGDEEMEGSMELDMPNLGCRHYKRNVKVQCFDCHRWFPCRHCHDSAHDLPFQHNLRRKMTKNMLCMLCQTPQPAAETCAKCGEYAAHYFCPKCKLWDNDSNKRIYHCDDCGICRVGEGLGKDFVHCKRCNVCISISTSAAHPCVEGATERDCPLCLDDLFESQKKAVSMPCGHYMHGECYQDLMRVTYKCPVCSKSAVNMELQWRKLDDEIRAQPMPDDEEELGNLLPHVVGQTTTARPAPPENTTNDNPSLAPARPRTVYVGCNDCGRRSWTPFHWLGVKCQHCDSYNTNQMAPPAGHETEAERLIRQQQVHRHHDFTGEGVLRDAGIQPGGEERADSALDVPPASLLVPGSPSSSSASGLPSPPRYFVRDEDDEPRRPSFTARGFSTPSLPNLPDLSRLPRMPNLPALPNMPNIPDWPNMPQMPNYLPSMALPHLEVPRLTAAYEMMDSLSRSLSPMRYYLQGLDMRDDGILGRSLEREGRGREWEGRGRERERAESEISVRSDPTADATAEKREGMGGGEDDDDERGFWGARARAWAWAGRGGENFGKGDEEAVVDGSGSGSEGKGEGEDDEEEEESDSDDDSDAGMPLYLAGDEDEDDDEDEDEDELALLGHR